MCWRTRSALFLLAVVAVAVMAGCEAGDSTDSTGVSEAAVGGVGSGAVNPGEGTVKEEVRGRPGVLVTLVPAGRLYVTAEDRLVLPTLTPVPVVSESSPVVGDDELVMTAPPVVSGDALVTVEEAVDFERFFLLSKPPCLEDFRAVLTAYEGPETFGPEVVRRLSGEFAERREDCVAAGWAPRFSLDPVCETGRVQNGLLPITLVGRDLRGRPVARPTASDYFGMMLVHLERFPFVDEGGCWFYDGNSRRWYWQRWDLQSSSEDRAVRGVDWPRFPGCEEYLRYLMEVRVADDGSWDSLGVARLVSRVMETAWEDCGGVNGEGYAYWGLHPTVGAQPGCGVAQDTGSGVAGVWVVNWVAGHVDADGNPCWVLRSGEGWYLGDRWAPLLSGLDLPPGQEVVPEGPGGQVAEDLVGGVEDGPVEGGDGSGGEVADDLAGGVGDELVQGPDGSDGEIVDGGGSGENGEGLAPVPPVEDEVASSGETAEPPVSAPAPPTGLTAATSSHDWVWLRWDDPQDDSVTGYQVLRRNPGIDGTGVFEVVVEDTGSPDNQFVDGTVVAGTRYVYWVKAMNGVGLSEQSDHSVVDTLSVPEVGIGTEVDGTDEGEVGPAGGGVEDSSSRPGAAGG